MTATLLRLYEHLAWADARLLATLEAVADPPAEALRLFAHVLGAERVWLARIRGEAEMPCAVWPELSLARCRTLAAEAHEGFRQLLAGLDPAGAAADLDYQDSQGVVHRTALSDILLHVALHGAYHRGQVAAALKGAGHPPPATDFIRFARP